MSQSSTLIFIFFALISIVSSTICPDPHCVDNDVITIIANVVTCPCITCASGYYVNNDNSSCSLCTSLC